MTLGMTRGVNGASGGFTRGRRSGLLVVATALLAGGCGGDDSGPGSDTQAETDASTTASENTTNGDAGTDSPTTMGPGTSTAGTDGPTDASTSDTGTETTGSVEPPSPDVNGDGVLNILVIGTSSSIREGAEAFSPDSIAAELQSILSGDPSLSLDVNVVAEDVYRSAQIVTGYGQAGDEYDWAYHSHSLAQYYYWPEGRDERLAELAGDGELDWDQVIIGADPNIVAETPGYYALGVNKIAARVAEGDAQPRLLMLWPQSEGGDASIDHFAEFTYRAADGAVVELPVVPAGRAWEALADDKKDSAATHPTPNGAYVAAATIYAQLLGASAAASDYEYDDELAEVALSTVIDEADAVHYSGERSFISPFKSCEIGDRVLNYNHTGSSSENGILNGFKWVCAKGQVDVVLDGAPPIDFNYGRANTEFEPNKRYKIDPASFEFSLGFPMQDNGNHGDTSMLYGLDKRRNDQENGTDLGSARKMVRDAELPYARTLPIRTLYAQMVDAIPGQSAYSDNWHMHKDLDKATGAFMYTLLTGHCALDEEPADAESPEWRSWMSHKIGYETAWTLMHLKGAAPGFRVLPESPESTSVSTSQSAQLFVSFANPPTAEITVTLSTDNDAIVSYAPSELTFTPGDYATPQPVTMTALEAGLPGELFTISASASSTDPVFDGLVDRWEYSIAE